MARFRDREGACACGSGRRYARCCLPRDRAAALGWRVLEGGLGSEKPSPGPTTAWRAVELPEPIRRLESWEADILSLPAPPETGKAQPQARAMVMVVAGDYILYLGLLELWPLGEAECIRALESAVLHAADEVGNFPVTLHLRRPELAQQLAAALARWQVRCKASQRLLGIDRLAQGPRHPIWPADGAWPLGHEPGV